MKFYYDGVGYPCKWKTKMNKSMWYSQEPAKLRVTLPVSVYDKIKRDIKADNGKLFDIIKFKILKNENEKLNFYNSNDSEKEMWQLECCLEYSIICSEFKESKENKLFSVIFDLTVMDNELMNKSDMRELILNEIL
jgi:hypothetical protein